MSKKNLTGWLGKHNTSQIKHPNYFYRPILPPGNCPEPILEVNWKLEQNLVLGRLLGIIWDIFTQGSII